MIKLSSDMCASDVRKIRQKQSWTEKDTKQLGKLKRNMGQSKLTRMRLRFSDDCRWINLSEDGKQYRKIRVLEEQRKKLRKMG